MRENILDASRVSGIDGFDETVRSTEDDGITAGNSRENIRSRDAWEEW